MVTPVDAWLMKIEKKIEYLVECRTHERVTKKKKTYLKTVQKECQFKTPQSYGMRWVFSSKDEVTHFEGPSKRK